MEAAGHPRHPAHLPARRRRRRPSGSRRSPARPTISVVGDSDDRGARALAGARRRRGRGRLPGRGRHRLRPDRRADTAGGGRARGARRLAAGPALRRADDLPDAARDGREAAGRRSTRSARAVSRCATSAPAARRRSSRNHEVPEITEVRAGTYVYGDRSCIANGSVPLEDCALRIRATVVSRPTDERGILDSGSKTLTNDPAEEASGGGHGPDRRVPGRRDLRALRGARPRRLRRLRRGGRRWGRSSRHPESRVRLHQHARRGRVHRSGRIVGFWPVAARGKLR